MTSPTPSNVPTEVPQWRYITHDTEMFLEYKNPNGPWVQAGIFFPSVGFSVGDFMRMVGQLRHAPALPGGVKHDRLTLGLIAYRAFAKAMNQMVDGVNYPEDKPPHEEEIALNDAAEAVANHLTAPKTNDADSLLREFADVIRFGGSPERVKKLEEYLATAPKTLPEGGAETETHGIKNSVQLANELAQQLFPELHLAMINHAGASNPEISAGYRSIQSAYLRKVDLLVSAFSEQRKALKSVLTSPTKETNI